jgi:hypothetical protein
MHNLAEVFMGRPREMCIGRGTGMVGMYAISLRILRNIVMFINEVTPVLGEISRKELAKNRLTRNTQDMPRKCPGFHSIAYSFDKYKHFYTNVHRSTRKTPNPSG